MIAKLRGIIDQVGEDYIVMDVSGVGYLVYCSSKELNIVSLPFIQNRYKRGG